MGRFAQADSIVPLQSQGVQAWDRYAYVNNNPVRYSDLSGHSIFDAYMHGWANFNSAWSIVTNGNASIGDRAVASTYVVVWGGAHMLGATGLVLGGVAATQAVVGAVTTATTTATTTSVATTATTTACADGDCTNEVRVFWSGGKTALDAATAWAEANGGTTLEMTSTGQYLEKITREMDYLTEAKPLWEQASADFAQGANEIAHVFLNAAGISSESIWTKIEMPILVKNGVRIITHFAK